MLARTWADFRWAEEATHELGAPTSYNNIIIISSDNAHGVIIMTKVIARVHPVHLMNAD